MSFRVVFTPEAEEQLVDLYRYIAAAATPVIAERDGIRPGLRIVNYKGRTVIAFAVDAR